MKDTIIWGEPPTTAYTVRNGIYTTKDGRALNVEYLSCAYCCPSLQLRGLATGLHLIRAIEKKLKAKIKSQATLGGVK